MSWLRNWSFHDLCSFLRDYGFILAHINGSHHFFYGKICGRPVMVQAINSNREKESQSYKTMKMALAHSGIPRKYFEDWKRTGMVYREIIG